MSPSRRACRHTSGPSVEAEGVAGWGGGGSFGQFRKGGAGRELAWEEAFEVITGRNPNVR